ncbi:prolyl oligopeptidase family serine peptidase [Pusillimonas sp. MFBS29]|uniref:alpha/beta hydrolase family protein n=1 Tax=Pusillimonas sp. MFBS29 TaxID=2886690 RepID=UPI001D102F16|nr:prolyl oligopeptidase family serine peptidase [Pusillimonas sp. MFBS29]MCC2596473.1 prolyl oligopeptidase family serine peptidase [Pusillimonas sp. MFBS29]
MGSSLERGRTRVAGFANPEMDFQLMRQLGASRYGGASVGECLALVRNIENGVPESWVTAFAAAAQRQEDDAQRRAARGHAVSAYDQYLVASNSYRAAEYYTRLTDPKHTEYGLKSRSCFLAAMGLQDHAIDVVELPFDQTPLPAYLIRPSSTPRSALKTLMIISGYDGTLEETYIAYGRAALERGYQLMLFAGPGQMDTMRFYPKLHFIPEYEKVAATALDYLLARPDTSPEHVALMGISFGGYFATRMAAHDARIKALIANSPIVDLHAYMAAFVGFDPAKMADKDDFLLIDIEHIPADVMPPQTREMTQNLMLRFGCDSFKQTYQRLRDFHVTDQHLADIRCPALALAGAGEGPQPLAQYQQFQAQISGPVSAHLFTDEEGADGHCQTGNLAYSAAVSMDWLDETWA